jgi:hypothetical protein
MTTRAGAGRCDPSVIEAARGGDAEALVSLIAIAQPDIRRYAARPISTTRFRKRCCCFTGASARCAR